MSLLKQRLDVSDFYIYSASYGGVQSTMKEFPSRDLGIGSVDHSILLGAASLGILVHICEFCSRVDGGGRSLR